MTKSIIYRYCLDFIEARIANIKDTISQAHQASADDTKSSAGDKYETTREMMQQEIDRNGKMLYEAGQQKIALQQVENVGESETVRNGSLVFTSNGNFYISISAGELKLEDKKVFAISQASPLGKILLGKKVGESFSFNGKTVRVEEIL